jgi:hypothetical protein
MTRFWKLFTTHVGASLGKQLALTDYLGERGWEVDIHSGTIDFGEKGTFPIQVLGSESEIDWTWLWAWANDELAGRVPDRTLDAARRVRDYGQQHDIPELVAAELDLDEVDGHTLALLCSALCDADAYYRVPYADGAGFFLIHDTPLRPAPTPAARIKTIISETLALWPIEPRPMIEAYLKQEGFTCARAKNRLRARAPDGRQVDVTLDSRGRLVEIAVSAPES